MNEEIRCALRAFVESSNFAKEGAVMTDLDGTAVHEFEGRIVIPDTVSHGLKHLRDLGQPVLLNTLRFPRNVIQSFGREWYAISNAPLPLVSLNGSLVGHLQERRDGDIVFEEIDAFPLRADDIEEMLIGVRGLVEGGVLDLVIFFYPRDWTIGEIIWTPAAGKISELREKYRSASAIVSFDLEELRRRLLAQDVCMVFLLIEAPEDQLMAYQHTKRSNFITRAGVDKLSGARALATRLGIDLSHAVGAGDTPMDTFLSGVGLSVHVGSMDLEYKGLSQTLRVRDSLEFGGLLFELAKLQHEMVA